MKIARKKTDFWENTGKYLLDISKLFFGAIFLGGVLRLRLGHDILILSGFSISIVLCIIGLMLASKVKED